jgi:hypothetical protein
MLLGELVLEDVPGLLEGAVLDADPVVLEDPDIALFNFTAQLESRQCVAAETPVELDASGDVLGDELVWAPAAKMPDAISNAAPRSLIEMSMSSLGNPPIVREDARDNVRAARHRDPLYEDLTRPPKDGGTLDLTFIWAISDQNALLLPPFPKIKAAGRHKLCSPPVYGSDERYRTSNAHFMGPTQSGHPWTRSITFAQGCLVRRRAEMLC